MSRHGHLAAVVVFLLAASACGEVAPTATTSPPDQTSPPSQSTSTTEATPTTQPAATTPASTTPATTEPPPPLPDAQAADEGPPSGLIHFGFDGISVAPFDGSDVAIPGDRFYPAVWRAEPDGVGGMVYQLLERHPAWPDGTIFRLRPGDVSPTPAFVPSRDTRTELYDVIVYNGERSLLLGHQLIGVRDWTTVVVVPFDGTEPYELLKLEGLVDQVSFGGHTFVAETPTSPECTTPLFFDSSGQVLDPPPAVGCNLRTVINPHLSADGSLLVYQFDEAIRAVSLTSGDRWELDGYLVDYDGGSTLVSIGPETGEAWLVSVGSAGFGERTLIDDPGWARLYSHSIEVAEGATLELRQPEVECSANGALAEPVPVELPAAVAATRDAIAAAAARCDFDELGALAEPHESFEFYTSCCAFRTGMEYDPVRFWLVGETSESEEMLQLVRLLAMEPGRTEGGWVWPAAVVQSEAEIDWPALEKLLTGPYEMLYEVSRDRGYYNGFIVEITDTGKWTMFKQVIDPPIAG